MNTFPKNISAILVMAALALGGCGGGGGGGDAGAPPPPAPQPPPPTGGITRTGVAEAVGPITGFGSVIVNGIRYDTSAATFTKDGQAATQDDFSVGEVVFVKGTINDDNTNAVAQTVAFEDAVEGPVSNVDTVAGSIVVLGQVVLIGADTSVDDSCPGTLDALLGVPAVEVSGLVKSDGTIDATRIECRSVAGEFEVNGVVSGLTATTFMINGLVVDFSEALEIADFPGGSISNGDPVEAKGTNFDSSVPRLNATRVEFKGNRFDQNEGDHFEIEGFITRFISATDFDVSGRPVTTVAGTTVYEGGSASDLGLNLKVEAEGEINAAGVLVATKVEIKLAKAVRITGLVDGVSGSSLTILGITVNTDTVKTRFEDKTDVVDPLRIGDIVSGDYVEVRGQEFPAGSGDVFAAIVERDDARSRTELRGFVEAGGVNRPTLTVLGVSVVTDGDTQYRRVDGQSMPVEDFWAAVAAGSLIDVRGTETGTQTLAAEELELESE